MNPAFDTLKAVKDLRNAGAKEELAEATVATISTAINEQVATKADLEVVQVDLKSDIKAVGLIWKLISKPCRRNLSRSG